MLHSCPHIWFTSHSYFREEVLPAHRYSHGVWGAGFHQRREQWDLDIQKVGNLSLPQELGATKSSTTASIQCQKTTFICEPNPLQQWLVRLSEYLRLFSDFFSCTSMLFVFSQLSSGNVRSGREGWFLRREQQKVHKGCSVTCPSTDRYPSFYNNFWYKRNRVIYRYIIQEILYFSIKCLSTFAL